MKKNLTKKIIGIVLSFMILFGCIPMKVYALPGDDSQPGLTQNNPGQYDIDGRPVLIYVTSNGGYVSRTSGANSDTSQQFTATAYDNWTFYKWLTFYEGPSSQAPNPNFTWNSDWCFSRPGDAETEYTSSNATIQVNREWDAKGTYYLYAIFRPKVTIETDMSSTISFRTAAPEFVSGIGSVETYVPYGNIRDIQIHLDNNRVVESVKINNSIADSNTYQISNGWLKLNDIYVTRPTNINVVTRKKIQNINFDANGGTGIMEQQTFNSGEEKTLSQNTFTRDKYRFIGWNTKADGTGIDYEDKTSAIFTPTNDRDNITLYAQWERLPNATYTAPTAKDLTYKAEEQELITKGTSNEGVLMYSLEENGAYEENIPTAKKADRYTVWYYVKGDNNHNDSDKASLEVEIKKANPDIGAVSANIINDTTDIASVVLNRTDENIAGSFVIKENQSLNLGDNIIKYEFVPNDTLNYNVIDGQVSVTVKDTISPVGTVTYTDTETVWDDIPGAITFEMYFKNEQKVIVSATDSFSGVDKIEFYEANEVLDLEGVKLITEEEWNLVEGDINIPVEDGKQFIYYIRITDKSGNIGYIATNGAEFDTTAPVITGVYDGKTYYTSQKVTVTDKNLDTVTLNGEIITDTIILEGNKEATYTIVATDKVGNSTTVTVKMAMIDEIVDVDDVTPEDKLKLEDAKSELEKNLEENSDIYSEEEKKAIEDKIKAIEEDLNEIENLKEEKIQNTDNLKNPTTGDNIGKYFTMFIVSIVGISVIILRKKKKTK